MSDATTAAKALVEAFAEVSDESLRAVLHPEARVRCVTPEGVEDYRTPQEAVDAFVPWFGYYDTCEVVQSDIHAIGDVISASLRFRLTKDDESFVMDIENHLYEVEDGRIRYLGELCSGPQPEA